MTTTDDIVFFCVLCGQKIAIQEPKGGFVVECPACHGSVPVPRRRDAVGGGAAVSPGQGVEGNGLGRLKPPTVTGAKRIVIAKGALLAKSEAYPAAAAPGSWPVHGPVPPRNNGWLLVVGGACLVLGMLSAVLAPHAILVHNSLFLAALIVSILCMARDFVVAGAMLLVVTGLVMQWLEVPLVAPLLKQFVPKPAVVQQIMPPPPPAFEEERLPVPAAPVAAERAPAAPAPAVVPVPEEPMIPAAAEPERPALEAPVAEEKKEVPAVALAKPAAPAPAAVAPAPAVMSSKPPLPLAVYSDCSSDPPFCASGWMGYFDAIELDECWDENPHSGKTCIRMAYNATYYWGGVAWQNPPNNWGDVAGGFDLSGAKELAFWARAEKEGTIGEFKIGIRSSGPYADTAIVSSGKRRLVRQWKQYKLPLKGVNLSRVISGFVCVVEGTEIPPIIYLDDIEYR